MKLRFLIFLLLFASAEILAQNNIDTTAIRKQLEMIYERDQKTRTGADSAAFMGYIDSTNLVQVEVLIEKYGWPGKSFVGPRGNTAVFLVIQHADLKTQEKYLPLMEQSVAEKESRKQDLALLKDRILMRQGKKQMYGSQIVRDTATGGWIFYPIEDEENINRRREEAGLSSIEEYATYFGIKREDSLQKPVEPKIRPAVYYGIGWGTNKYNTFFSSYYKLSLIYQPKHISVSYFKNVCSVLFPSGFGIGSSRAMTDNTFMAGYRLMQTGKGNASLIISTGISILKVKEVEVIGERTVPRDFEKAVGVPINIQLDVGMRSAVGWGLSLHGNLGKFSYLSTGFNIRFFRVAPKKEKLKK